MGEEGHRHRPIDHQGGDVHHRSEQGLREKSRVFLDRGRAEEGIEGLRVVLFVPVGEDEVRGHRHAPDAVFGGGEGEQVAEPQFLFPADQQDVDGVLVREQGRFGRLRGLGLFFGGLALRLRRAGAQKAGEVEIVDREQDQQRDGADGGG